MLNGWTIEWLDGCCCDLSVIECNRSRTDEMEIAIRITFNDDDPCVKGETLSLRNQDGNININDNRTISTIIGTIQQQLHICVLARPESNHCEIVESVPTLSSLSSSSSL